MKTIFILDGNFSHQNEMTEHLTAMGFAVRSFLTADEFENVNEKPFAILLDENMENKDRFTMQFLKHVRKRMSRVPVVYMVSITDKKRIQDAKKAGAYEVIEKSPAVFVNLRTTLDRLESEPSASWFKRLFRKNMIVTYGLS
jgi:DNA-binding NtrC family response regulator